LHNHVDDDVRSGDVGKNPGSHSRLVAHACDAEFCLVPVEANPPNHHVLHAGGLFFGKRSAPLGKARSHFKFDAKFFSKLYRA
jgi:hypothetical protein